MLQKIGGRGIAFLVMILLARLLTPKAFGLIGMLMIFIQLSKTLVDGGLKMALIQKKNTNERDYSSVFYINLVISLVLYLIIFFTGPLIANFYQQPILAPLVRVLSLDLIINAFSLIQETRLTKKFHFKTLAIIHIPSTILGGIGSILMAIFNYGVWSIVAFWLINRFTYTAQIWIYSAWKPLLTFKWQRIKSLFAFGGNLLIARIIGVIYDNLFLVVIGKFYPLKSVGYYQNSYQLTKRPSGTFTSALNSVIFPAFSSIQDDNKRLKSGYKRVIQQAFFWICPAYTFASVLAYPLFGFIFGPQWLPAVPYFRWLCVMAIMSPLCTYNLNILNVKGRSDVFLKLQLIRRGITIIAVISVFSFSITALLIVQAASSIFTYFLFSYFSGKFINYYFSEQIKDVMPILLLSLVTGLIIFLLDQQLFALPNFIRLIIGTTVGISIYWLVSHWLSLSPYMDFREIFREKILSNL